MAEEGKTGNEWRESIDTVDGGRSINNLINEVNYFNRKFEREIKNPLDAMKADSLKLLLLGKTKGANIKHAYIGAVLGMIASLPDLTQEELMKQFQFFEEDPYVSITVVDDQKPIFD